MNDLSSFDRLLGQRRYNDLLQKLDGSRPNPQTLAYKRAALALSGRLDEAGQVSAEIVSSSEATAADFFRDGEIQSRLSRFDMAAVSLEMAIQHEFSDWRLLQVFAEVSLNCPDRAKISTMVEKLDAYWPKFESQERIPALSAHSGARVTTPQDYPFMHSFNGAHPAHMRYLDRSALTRAHSRWPCFDLAEEAILWCKQEEKRLSEALPDVQLVSIRHFLSRRFVSLLRRDVADLDVIASVLMATTARPFVLFYDNLSSLFACDVNANNMSLDRRDDLYHLVKTLLESSACRAIVPYTTASIHELKQFFESDVIAEKCDVYPLATCVRSNSKTSKRQKQLPPFTFLFMGSHYHRNELFYVRRGREVIEAFVRLREVKPECRLIIRSKIPEDVRRWIADLQGSGHNITVFEDWLDDSKLSELQQSSHVSLHVGHFHFHNGFIECMANGTLPISSDLPSARELIEHGSNGLLIKFEENACLLDPERGHLNVNYERLTETPISSTNDVEKILFAMIKARSILDHSPDAGSRNSERVEKCYYDQKQQDSFDEFLRKHALHPP